MFDYRHHIREGQYREGSHRFSMRHHLRVNLARHAESIGIDVPKSWTKRQIEDAIVADAKRRVA